MIQVLEQRTAIDSRNALPNLSLGFNVGDTLNGAAGRFGRSSYAVVELENGKYTCWLHSE